MGLKLFAPLLVRLDLADRVEEFFELGETLDRVIELDGGLPHADRAGENLDVHLVGAGLAANVAQPTFAQLDDLLLVAEPGIDLPACNEHGVLLLDLRTG